MPFSKIEELENQYQDLLQGSASEETNIEKVNILNELATTLRKSDPGKCSEYVTEALNLAKDLQYGWGIVESSRILCLYYDMVGDFEKAVDLGRDALELSLQLEDELIIAKSRMALGIAYCSSGKFGAAIDYYLNAVKGFEILNNKRGIAHAYRNIAIVYKAQEDIPSALKYNKLSLKLYEEINDFDGIADTLNNIGVDYLGVKDYDSALDYFKESLCIKEKIGNKVGISRALNNIGSTYQWIGDNDKALAFFLRSLKIKEETGDKRGAATSTVNVGVMYGIIGEYDKSLEYLQSGLDLAIKMGSKETEALGYQNLANLYEAIQDYENAFDTLKKYNELSGELIRKANAKKVTNLQVKYETECKEKEAELYRLRNVELKEEIEKRVIIENELQEHQEHLEKTITIRTEELRESLDKLGTSREGIILTISKIVETRDPYTSGHQLRTAIIAKAIATEMGLSTDQIEGIYIAAVVHDIGKIAIPHQILSKPGKLTEIEFKIIKTHVDTGYDILRNVSFPWPISKIVKQHHERLDGSGYPDGLMGKDITLEARILAVADVIEAMSSHRPYRPKLSPGEAINEIRNNQGTKYDSDVVSAYIHIASVEEFDLQRI